jgi:hypothetical protein
MPLAAVLLSLVGLAPFVVCGLAALGPSAGTAGAMLTALITWAALVLAFTGGIHWGLVLRETEPVAPMRHLRLALAVLPLLVGWAVLLLPLLVGDWPALLLLIVGFIAGLLLEHHAGRRGMLPPRYLWLRWGFTVVAVAMLTTVLTLRLLGQTIVF